MVIYCHVGNPLALDQAHTQTTQSLQITLHKYAFKPGPASTVEEHSLRNFSFPADRGSILAVGDFFSDALYTYISDGRFNISDKSLNSRNHNSKKLLQRLSLYKNGIYLRKLAL